MEEKRKEQRKIIEITAVVRKAQLEGKYAIMEFKASNVSLSGAYIITENLDLFELGEQLEILVDMGGKTYYEGAAKVVRSARIFSEDNVQIESGYGLMFLNPSKEFTDQLLKKMHVKVD